MQNSTEALPATAVEQSAPASTSSLTKRQFAIPALICVAIAVALTAGLIGRDSGQTEFERRRDQAERHDAQAASTEKWNLIVSPQSWMHEEWTADSASRTIRFDIWRGVDEPAPVGPPQASFFHTEDSTFVRPSAPEQSSLGEPVWYLMDRDPMSQRGFELNSSSPWNFLDKHPDHAPHRAGTEDVDGVRLERFDLFIPADEFIGQDWMPISGIGFAGVDPRGGVEASFWFTDEGELRRLIVENANDDRHYYEYLSQLLTQPSPLEAPIAPRSWVEFEALQD